MNLRPSSKEQLISSEPHSASLAHLQFSTHTAQNFFILYLENVHRTKFLLTTLKGMTSDSARYRSDIDKIPPYVPGKQITGALKLASNEASFAPIPAVQEAAQRALLEADRYPDLISGKLREALAGRLELSPEQILIANGSTTVEQMLARLTCLSHDDEILFPWRSFEAYPVFARVVGAQPRPIPLTDAGTHDFAAMKAAINENTKLVFLCNPNNPTGTTMSSEEFESFMEAVPDSVLVCLDEAYREYNRAEHQPDAREAIAKYPNLVVARTFSKAYGLAGLRVGYVFGNPDIISHLQRVQEPFNVNIIGQAAALAALEHSEEILSHTEEVVAQRDRVADALGVARSQANFIWIPTEHSRDVAQQCLQAGVVVRAFPEGIRITITNEKEMDVLLDAWKNVDRTLY